MTSDSWKHWRMFDRFVSAADRTIRKTSTQQAPWHIVEGEDERYRSIVVGTVLRDAILRGLQRADKVRGKLQAEAYETAVRPGAATDRRDVNVLDHLDMRQRFDPKHVGLKRSSVSRDGSTAAAQSPERASPRSSCSKVGTRPGRRRHRRITGELEATDYEVIPSVRPRRREGPTLPVAVLAPPLTCRPYHDFRSGAGMAACWSSGWRIRDRSEYRRATAKSPISRSNWSATRHPADEVLDPHQQGRTAAAFPDRMRTAHKRWKITPEDWRNRAAGPTILWR